MDTTDDAEIEADLKANLEGMVRGLFGELNDDEVP